MSILYGHNRRNHVKLNTGYDLKELHIKLKYMIIFLRFRTYIFKEKLFFRPKKFFNRTTFTVKMKIRRYEMLYLQALCLLRLYKDVLAYILTIMRNLLFHEL